MKAKRLALIFSLLIMFAINSHGQRIRYRDVKNEIAVNNFRHVVDDPKYIPLVAGLLTSIIPASGYFYVGEPLRGALVFCGLAATYMLFAYGLLMSMSAGYESGQAAGNYPEVMFAGMIASGLLQLWSIYDVVRIAKVKSIAYQNSKVFMTVEPEISIANKVDAKILSPGIRLSLRF